MTAHRDDGWFRVVPVGMLLVSCSALTVYAQQSAAVSADPGGSDTVTIALIGFFSTLVALLIQMWREARSRRWDREDRAAQRAEFRAATILLKAETVATATTLAKLTKTEHAKLLAFIAEIKAQQTNGLAAAINENTALTAEVGAKADAAYSAANNFAAKLEAIQRTLGVNQGQLGDVQVTVEDTHALVEGIASPPGDPVGGGL